MNTSMNNPICGKPAGSIIPGTCYACVLSPGHKGECEPGGICHRHGPCVGRACEYWPDCDAPVHAEVELSRPLIREYRRALLWAYDTISILTQKSPSYNWNGDPLYLTLT